MTFQEQNRLAGECAELWRTIMPDVPTPDKSQILIWIGMFPESAVLRGINRAGAKVLRMKQTHAVMSTNDAHRYASAVMRSEAQGVTV
jgi:hypothetical protein